MNTTLAISEPIEPRWRQALEQIPGLTLLWVAPTSALLSEAGVWPVEVRRVSGDAVERLHEEKPEPGQALLLLIDAVLNDALAAELEDRDIGFVDATGRAWVPGTRRSPQVQQKPGRTASASVRAAQVLADHPNQSWTEAMLADHAQVSTGTAHNLLRRLTKLGLVARIGKGRGARAEVTDARSLRRWVVRGAGHDDSPRVWCYVRDIAAVPVEHDGVPLIRSGSAGASLMGLPVMSSVSTVLVRAPVDAEALEDLPAGIRALRTARAANLLLVADVDRLATVDPRRLDSGVWVASPSRIAIDLGLEPRGTAAADVFLELWGDEVR